MYFSYDFSYSSRHIETDAILLHVCGFVGVGVGRAGLACINLPELSRSDQKYHGNCSMRLDLSKF